MINSRDLADLRPDVRANVETLLKMCKAQGLNVLITQTLRDDEYQAYLYQQGRTRPGAIVTNSRTTTFHGKGLAVDFCRNSKGHEYDDAGFFRNVAVIAKAIGFSWGGDWTSFRDYPHLQWDDHGRYTTAMLRAGKAAPAMPKYEEEEMDDKQIYEAVQRHAAKIEMPANVKDEYKAAVKLGLTDGSAPGALMPAWRAAVMSYRAYIKGCKHG